MTFGFGGLNPTVRLGAGRNMAALMTSMWSHVGNLPDKHLRITTKQSSAEY